MRRRFTLHGALPTRAAKVGEERAWIDLETGEGLGFRDVGFGV